jgi:N-acetyl sugar amidotransferase
MDESVPDIWFDDAGECNYCKMHDRLSADNPNDERGASALEAIVTKTRRQGKGRPYDVVIGVSGGTDSTYLLHLAVEYGLRPLAVHLDNGWNTETSVTNLRNVLEALDIDLHTHVINWQEFKDILRAQLRSGLPWADSPTDLAIIAVLYQTAVRYGVKTIFVGNNFRTEGRQPSLWTHSDSRQLGHVHSRFGSGRMKTYPTQSPFKLIFTSMFHGVKMHRPYYHIPFNKSEAKVLIKEKYGWQEYGGHHHENIFTRYAIGVWMPQKFGIDKRKVTIGAYIRNGEMERSEALTILSQPAYDPDRMLEDHAYVAKKLGLSSTEMDAIWAAPNKSVHDYPSYLPLFSVFMRLGTSVFRHILPFRPMMSYDMAKPKQS